MRPKTLKTLFVVFVGLAALWGLSALSSRQPEPKARYLWEKAQDAKRISIGVATLAKQGSEWILEQPFSAKADKAKIEDFLAKLAKATLSEVVSSDPERQEYFQVTPSSGIRLQGFLEDKAAAPALDVLVGKSGSEYDSILLRRPSDNDVLEGRGMSRYEFDQEPSRWADRTLVKLESSTIRAIELRSGKETVRLKQTGGRWRLNDVAVSTSAVSALIEPMLSRLRSLDADEVLPQSSASSTTLKGLKSPGLTIIVRFADGVASAGANIREKTIELTVAPKGADSRYAVRKRGDKLIYLISEWALEAFRKKEFNFRDSEGTTGT